MIRKNAFYYSKYTKFFFENKEKKTKKIHYYNV